MNIAEFLNTNTQKFPSKAAIGFKKKDKWTEISWSAFRRLVFKTANALRSAGVTENDKVAIYSDNSAEWIVFDLAILSLGAITVPIYATNNQEQAAYILEESECKMILVGSQEQYDAAFEIVEQSEILKQIIVAKKSIWIKKIASQYMEDFIKNADDNFEIVPKEDRDVATIIYTSGTTGLPKGVMLTHGNFHNAVKSHFDYFKFKNFENETSLAFLPLTHVFERSWTIIVLSGGAKVYFLENTKLIANALAEIKPTLMCAVPRFYQKIYAGVHEMANKNSKIKNRIFSWAMAVGSKVADLRRIDAKIPFGLFFKNAVANQLVFNKVKAKMGGRLWFMASGGAAISPEVTQFFESMGIHISVGYGLTETTATLTAFPFHHFEHGSAGRALGDTQIKIGENEEILVKGSGIMKGYYKNEAETAKVFTSDGWFKTGDAGKLDEVGNLFITDRIKDLLKTSNGKYVAPQPIESSLSNSNFIDQVLLVAEGKPYVSALIIPNFEALKAQLNVMNIQFTSWQEIVELKSVRDFYKTKIEEIQENLSGFEKIKKFVILPAELEISSGEITPTLKIKRKFVLEKYAALVDKMYTA